MPARKLTRQDLRDAAEKYKNWGKWGPADEIGTLNQVVHLWGFDGLDDRARRRAEMAKDPAWAEFMRRNEELGALMHQESKIVTPVRFSPIK